MNRREFVTSALLAAGAGSAGASGWMRLGEADTDGGGFRVTLENVLDHPFYGWPETLLSYPIASVDLLKGKHMVDGADKTVACQAFMEGGKPKLAFFADLPAGESRSFSLADGVAVAETARAVKISRDATAITLDSGKMQVKIPVSQTITGDAPGPIMAVSRGAGWHGSSTFHVTGHRVVAIETSAMIEGPLVTEYRIVYKLDGGGSYVANVRCVAGYEFVRLREDMDGLPEDARGTFEFNWKGTDFTNRQTVNHPYPFPMTPIPGAKYEDYGWEPIDAEHMNTHIGMAPALNAAGEWVVHLGVYQPWPIFTVQTSLSFFGAKSMDTVGLFIDSADEWNDHDYAIWHGSSKLKLKFKYAEGALKWMWPVAKGSRSCCFAFYDHARDKEQMERLSATNAGVMWKGARYTSAFFVSSHVFLLQIWYGTIHLDEVKDWVLTYSGKPQKVVFTESQIDKAPAVERMIEASAPVTELPISGSRQSLGINPSQSGGIIGNWIATLNRTLPQMDERERKRITAASLMMAYIHASEGYMPMKGMLSGHPNFLAEVQSSLAGLAFLFPDHPMAPYWAAEFDAYVELNTRYHVRPEVKAWDARGGRWTENLGTYVWGFLVHSLRASFLLKQMDGRDHFAQPQSVPIAEWLVNALSAPFAGETPEALALFNFKDQHNWGILRPEQGPRRMHLPQGAHAERRTPPREMWYFGQELRNFAPLTAEALMWAARPTDSTFEHHRDAANPTDAWEILVKAPENKGTNPHLESSKFTGYGMTLRAGVDTPQEISVHLQQIDDGPNYRWGVSAEGGCGLLYFVAGGKFYSHNGFEDAGDRRDQDTDFCTNFGVWKGTQFHSVGQNVLTAPLLDLGVAQHAELLPRQGNEAYSWPEYQGRSVLLVGTDYFLLYDKTFNPLIAHRLSWFVRRTDAFPHFTFLKGQEPRKVETAYTEVQTKGTVGRWYDGTGDSLVAVTHRDDLQVTPTDFGCKVAGPGVNDIVFRGADQIVFDEGGVHFRGAAGVVRERGGRVEIALIKGKSISAQGVAIEVLSGDVAVSAEIGADGISKGRYHSMGVASFTLRTTGAKHRLYVDGLERGVAMDGRVTVTCDKGLHQWELVAGLPTPLAPRILRTEYVAGGARVFFEKVAGASGYILERSDDGGTSWRETARTATPMAVLGSLRSGIKCHVRAIAFNAERRGEAGREYPVYGTEAGPAAPAGLHVEEANGSLRITWGEVLGVTEYRLYLLGKGGEGRVIYRGLERAYTMPSVGRLSFAITAASDLGEGPKAPVRMHPDPYGFKVKERPDKRFRRTPTYGIVDDVAMMPNDGFGEFYPE